MSHVNPQCRLRSVTYDYALRIQDASGETREHRLAICVARDEQLRPVEVNFVSRGKIGGGLDMMLHELGIAVSRSIQDRDPQTGQDIP